MEEFRRQVGITEPLLKAAKGMKVLGIEAAAITRSSLLPLIRV